MMHNDYGSLFAELGLRINPDDTIRFVLFPGMRTDEDVPEVADQSWRILDRAPDSVMCASSRMVIKRKGAQRPTVVACILLPYDTAFELGATLADATTRPVKLNHRNWPQFLCAGRRFLQYAQLR